MDIERLTKSQIVLLTLLVSFVTSIATGIVTITLMEQAPPAITQTVNRIVERTIETVSPAGQVAAASQTETVVVRESDLIANAVSQAEGSLVRLYTPGRDENGRDAELFVGFGIVTSESGEIIADTGTPNNQLKAVRADGVSVPVTVITRPTDGGYVRLQAPMTAEKDGASQDIAWKPARFAANKPALGQEAVTIGGRTATRLGRGIVVSVSDAPDAGQDVIETDIPLDSYAAGSPLISADGIVGMATRESRTGASAFLAYSSLTLHNQSTDTATAP